MAIKFTIAKDGSITTSAEGFPGLMAKLAAELEGDTAQTEINPALLTSALQIAKRRSELLADLKLHLEHRRIGPALETAKQLSGAKNVNFDDEERLP